MIYLVEHFYSIQGEGRYVGVPSLFFRFGGCNMTCSGFGCNYADAKSGCDTYYAVDKELYAKDWVSISSSTQLISVLNSYDLPHKVDIVFTGGEPLIYAKDKIFIDFLEHLHKENHKITFETNGSLNIDFKKFPIYKEAIFALSVKLENSKEPYKKRVNKDAIFNLAQNAKEAFFKFSIDQESINISLDEEIEDIISHAPSLQTYCMPIASSKQELEKNSLPLIEYCKQKGYTFSDRLHIRVWNEINGV